MNWSTRESFPSPKGTRVFDVDQRYPEMGREPREKEWWTPVVVVGYGFLRSDQYQQDRSGERAVHSPNEWVGSVRVIRLDILFTELYMYRGDQDVETDLGLTNEIKQCYKGIYSYIEIYT